MSAHISLCYLPSDFLSSDKYVRNYYYPQISQPASPFAFTIRILPRMQSMAARRLLQCPELLAEIFSYLGLPTSPTNVDSTHTAEMDNEHRDLRKTLAAASLSCRALTEHAVAALWRRLESVQPLLSLLQPSKRERQSPKTIITSLQGGITEKSWLRFQAHTRHVRALHDPDWSAIHPSTWAFIARWCGTVPLLPSLEQLSVLPLVVQSPTSMMFITPKLRSLSLALRFDDSELEPGYGRLRRGDTSIVRTLFYQIVSTAPGIRTLSIQSNLPNLPPSCLHPIGALKDLTVLHALDCVADYRLLYWLGGCPRLHTLSTTIDLARAPPRPTDPIDASNYAPFDYGPHTATPPRTVRGSPDDLHLFLDTAVPSRLQTHTTVWDNDRTRRSVLRELTLLYPPESYTDEEADNSLSGAALVDVVRPALAIRGLRKVTLAFHEVPSLDDAGVLEMAQGWLRLTALHILPSGGARYRAHTTLTPAVLVALARQCPRLAELTLPEIKLDDVRGTEEGMPVVGQRAMRRLRLFFCHWVGNDDMLFTAALFLDRLFPCLDLRPSWKGEDEEDKRSRWSWDETGREAEKAWRRIEEFLFAMQVGRRHRAVLQGAASL
uniref:Ubiquitin ligase complex F-box protein GRR1, putative n=1 Tax=Ganoderma boninense TaxID=34458 RepID=A0A5K1JT27_9APHY|nr:Ubiquitin ligase complex F-box protein GRR1, putative [Ganoderma boninense]